MTTTLAPPRGTVRIDGDSDAEALTRVPETVLEVALAGAAAVPPDDRIAAPTAGLVTLTGLDVPGPAATARTYDRVVVLLVLDAGVGSPTASACERVQTAAM